MPFRVSRQWFAGSRRRHSYTLRALYIVHTAYVRASYTSGLRMPRYLQPTLQRFARQFCRRAATSVLSTNMTPAALTPITSWRILAKRLPSSPPSISVASRAYHALT